MTNVFGTFLLSKENDTYSGEFLNNHMKAFSKEEVKLTEGTDDEFVGRFDVSWKETAGNVTAVLEIDKESDDIYILGWTDVTINNELQNVHFSGRGVKRNNLLVCVYSMS